MVPESTQFKDWAGRELATGDVVLETTGRVWEIVDFDLWPVGQCREVKAIARGQRIYTGRVQGVRLNLAFRIAPISGRLPKTRAEGAARFNRLHDELVAASERERVAKRRATVPRRYT